jgi:hypothetical protein
MATPTNPEVLPTLEKLEVKENKNLISIMVLSMSLARAVLGKSAKQLEQEEGAQIIQFIEKTVQDIFPEVAPIILGMYGMELMRVMPILKNPQKLVQEMISQYKDNVSPNPESNME